MFSNQRHQLREAFFEAWEVFQKKMPLTAIQNQLVSLIQEHPEYIKIFENRDRYIDKDYLPEFGETNPFLHLSLHLSLREQIGLDRPKGIQTLARELLAKTGDGHQAEHRMIEVLAETLWQSQKDDQIPDEQEYLRRLKTLMQR